MATPWNSNISDDSYLAFDQKLKEGEWGSIDISSLDNPHQALDAPFKIPIEQRMKLRLVWGRRSLAQAKGIYEAGSRLETLDDNWDNAQKRFHFRLKAEEISKDPARRAAASLLHPLLTRGSGLEQTTYTYPEQVRFGYLQQSFFDEKNHPEVVAALSLLGLSEEIKDIKESTDELAQGLGMTLEEGPSEPPYKVLKAARLSCRDAFALTFTQLQDELAYSRPGEDRERLQRLLAPLESLLQEASPRRAASLPERKIVTATSSD